MKNGKTDINLTFHNSECKAQAATVANFRFRGKHSSKASDRVTFEGRKC
jgi:hypothetical protein